MFIPQIPPPWIESTCTRVFLLPGLTPTEKSEISATLNKVFSDTNAVLKMANRAIALQISIDSEITPVSTGAAMLVNAEKEFQDAVGALLTTYTRLLLRVVYGAAHRVLFTVGGFKAAVEADFPEAE